MQECLEINVSDHIAEKDSKGNIVKRTDSKGNVLTQQKEEIEK